jgi:hypothetical protein
MTENVNLRGPSTVVFEGYECEICGKRRTLGRRSNLHVKCSKIKQAKYLKLRSDGSTTE